MWNLENKCEKWAKKTFIKGKGKSGKKCVCVCV